jgi:hypothetical protein
MSYGIYFDSNPPPEALRQALHAVYGVPPELVYIGPYDGLKDQPGPDPVAVIIPTGGDFGNELGGGERLAEMTGATELEPI